MSRMHTAGIKIKLPSILTINELIDLPEFKKQGVHCSGTYINEVLNRKVTRLQSKLARRHQYQ